MKPIVYKQNGTNWWYTLYRDSKGKLTTAASPTWEWAIFEALAYVYMTQNKGDCE